MIVKSHHRPHIYFLFRDDNTEIEFYKPIGYAPRVNKGMRLTTEDKLIIKQYFK